MATAVVSRKKANHITDEIDGLFEIFLLVIPLVVKKIRTQRLEEFISSLSKFRRTCSVTKSDANKFLRTPKTFTTST
jgi:hypothetical protein